MDHLTHNFYKNLYEYFDSYESQFFQLEKEYKRELEGEQPIYAIDFSELFPYMYQSKKGVARAQINKFIIENLNDKFSILPGAYGELLHELEKIERKTNRKNITQIVYGNQAIMNFMSCFPIDINNEMQLLKSYDAAQDYLLTEVGDVLKLLSNKDQYSSISQIHFLFSTNKLEPIVGIKNIKSIPNDIIDIAKKITDRLATDRPEKPDNNLSDAIDVSLASLINQQLNFVNKKRITIFTETDILIRACKSIPTKYWSDGYLAQGTNYFKYRTKIQTMFDNTNDRHRFVKYWCEKSQELKNRVHEIGQSAKGKPIAPPLDLIDEYRKFDEECKKPLKFKEFEPSNKENIENAKKLYEILRDESEFRGKMEDSFEVTIEYLKDVHKDLKSFNPFSQDDDTSRVYKNRIINWLNLNDKSGNQKKSSN